MRVSTSGTHGATILRANGGVVLLNGGSPVDLVVDHEAEVAQAQAAVRALKASGRLRAEVAFGRHLSQRSVNMIAGGTDTPSRIERWCDDLLAQWPEA